MTVTTSFASQVFTSTIPPLNLLTDETRVHVVIRIDTDEVYNEYLYPDSDGNIEILDMPGLVTPHVRHRLVADMEVEIQEQHVTTGEDGEEDVDDMDFLRSEREDEYDAIMAKYYLLLENERKAFMKSDGDTLSTTLTEVALVKKYGGTYEIPCTVNGLPLKMIFDTGASDVTVSSVEASFMLKNGYLDENYIKGTSHYMTASGDIHEGTILKLKEVRLGDAVLKNIEASVVHNQKAPLLLGQSVLEKFGTITIDNVNSKLIIKQ